MISGCRAPQGVEAALPRQDTTRKERTNACKYPPPRRGEDGFILNLKIVLFAIVLIALGVGAWYLSRPETTESIEGVGSDLIKATQCYSANAIPGDPQDFEALNKWDKARRYFNNNCNPDVRWCGGLWQWGWHNDYIGTATYKAAPDEAKELVDDIARTEEADDRPTGWRDRQAYRLLDLGFLCYGWLERDGTIEILDISQTEFICRMIRKSPGDESLHNLAAEKHDCPPPSDEETGEEEN